MDAMSELLECTRQQGPSEQPFQPRSEHEFRVNAHTDARTRFMVECLFSIAPLPCQSQRVIQNNHSNPCRSMAYRYPQGECPYRSAEDTEEEEGI